MEHCPFDKGKEEDCLHWVSHHGIEGRCGIQTGDNEIINMKECFKDKFARKRKQKRKGKK